MSEKKKRPAVEVIEPSTNLKDRTTKGAGVKKPADMIKAAQALIDQMAGRFEAELDGYIFSLSSQAERAIEGDVSAIEQLRSNLHELKGQAGTFGYGIFSQIADLGLRYHAAIEEPTVKDAEAMAMYANALQVARVQKLTGDGGKNGQKLLAELSKITTKKER